MQDRRILAAIDVGTTKVCAIIARGSRAKGLEVLGFGIVPCSGLRKGNVVDVAATQAAVRAALHLAEHNAGAKIASAYVGVTGAHVSFENRVDTLDWVGKLGVITAEDLSRVPETVASSGKAPGREVIHALPIRYSLDGGESIKDPLGMHARRVQVETHLVTAASHYVKMLIEAVEGAGVRVEDLVLEPLASSEAVLTPQEKNQGAALVDIGGGTTDIVVFKNGSVCYTSVIPVGGYQFTNDIAMTYNTPYEAAEDAKLNYGSIEQEMVRSTQEITLPVTGRSAEVKVSQRDIYQLMRERAQELARLINVKLKEAGVKSASDIQLVLTGGVANMPGLLELMRRALSDKARLGAPNGRWDLPADLKDPSFSTGVGMLLWVIHNQRPEAVLHADTNGANSYDAVPEEPSSTGSMSRFFKQVRKVSSSVLVKR